MRGYSSRTYIRRRVLLSANNCLLEFTEVCLCRGGGVQTDVCVCVIPLCGTLFCFVLFLSPAYRSVGSTEVSITYILFMYSTKHKHTLLLALHRLRWSLSSSEFTIGTALLSPLALRRPFYHNHSIRIFVVPTCHSTLSCVTWQKGFPIVLRVVYFFYLGLR